MNFQNAPVETAGIKMNQFQCKNLNFWNSGPESLKICTEHSFTTSQLWGMIITTRKPVYELFMKLYE